MELQYHLHTFRHLLHKKPQFLEAEWAKLEAFEREFNFKLPASVKEWYSIEHATDILRKYDPYPEHIWLGIDQPPSVLGPTNLIYKPIDDNNRSALEYGAQALLIFRLGTQGVGSWAFCLDGSDDPIVLLELDEMPVEWKVDSAYEGKSFSDWVLDEIVEWRRDRNGLRLDRVVVGMESAEITAWKEDYNGWALESFSDASPADFDVLRRHFLEDGLITTKGGYPVYRFFAPGKQLLVADGLWWMSADDEQGLYEIAQAIWRCSNIAEKIEDFGNYFTDVIYRLRAENPAT
jgi:hypothetical protein